MSDLEHYDYDLFTIGAGPGGVSSSRLSARLGAKVGICESSRVGGTCVNRGCVPKKLLVYASMYRDLFADAAHYGWSMEAPPSHDWATLIENKNREIDRLNQIYLDMLSSSGVTLFEGHGEITGPHSVRVGKKDVTARHILIATGGKPALPPIPGIEHAVTSNEALDLAQLPERVLVMGGGYIACEFAGIFNGLGRKTTLALRADMPLQGFDHDLQASVAVGMERKGVRIASGAGFERIEKTSNGYVLHRHKAEPLEADLVMAATGRSPNTEGLGLEFVGLETGKRGEIAVNDMSTTSVPSIHAIGDVTNRVTLAPVAIAEGRALARALFDEDQTPLDYTAIPSAIFSQPAAASCGLTETAARARGETTIYRTKFRPMRSSFAGGTDEVMIKLVVETKTDKLLGAHMSGVEAPEVMQTLGTAIVNGLTKSQLDRTVAIHPTSAEEIVLLREPVAETS